LKSRGGIKIKLAEKEVSKLKSSYLLAKLQVTKTPHYQPVVFETQNY